MPQPCTFPSLGSCQKRFLWTHKEVDLVPHLPVSLVRHFGDAEKFHQVLGFESLVLFFRVSKQGPCFTAIKEDGVLEVTNIVHCMNLPYYCCHDDGDDDDDDSKACVLNNAGTGFDTGS